MLVHESIDKVQIGTSLTRTIFCKRYVLINFNIWDMLIFCTGALKGTSGRKKCSAQIEEREKCKITSHHRPQYAKWFSKYSISKPGIWARWTSPFCRFSASFSLEYDVTDAMLQDNEKMKVQYLRSLLFDLFESLQAITT